MSDDKDYAHMRDPEAQRTRFELWAIVIIVVVVVVGGLIWRVVAHKPAGRQEGYPTNNSYQSGQDPAAGVGVRTQPAAPRPIAP